MLSSEALSAPAAAPFTQDAREVILEALSSTEGKELFAKLLAPIPSATSPSAPPPSASAPSTAVEVTFGAACFLMEPMETGEVLAPAGLSEPSWADGEPNWADYAPSCPAPPEEACHSEKSAAGNDSLLAAPLPAASGRARLRREQYRRARARVRATPEPEPHLDGPRLSAEVSQRLRETAARRLPQNPKTPR